MNTSVYSSKDRGKAHIAADYIYDAEGIESNVRMKDGKHHVMVSQENATMARKSIKLFRQDSAGFF